MSESFDRNGVQLRIRTNVTDVDRTDQLMIYVGIKKTGSGENADVIGAITVTAGSPTTSANDDRISPPQISATFDTFWEGAPGRDQLQEIARRLGGHHFNFYQVLEHDVSTKVAFSQTATPPYVDPPRGGFPNSPGQTDGVWSDNIPWYHDEMLPPDVKEDPDDPVTAAGNVFRDGNSIKYYDDPHFDPTDPGPEMKFKTWLVLVNDPKAGATEAYRPVAFLGGFHWVATKNGQGGRTTEIHHRTDTDCPSDADYEQLLNAPTAGVPQWFDTDPKHFAP